MGMMSRHLVDTVTLDVLARACDNLLDDCKHEPNNYRLARLYNAGGKACDSYYNGQESAYIDTARAAALALADGDRWTYTHLVLAAESIIKERVNVD